MLTETVNPAILEDPRRSVREDPDPRGDSRMRLGKDAEEEMSYPRGEAPSVRVRDIPF